MKVGKLFISSRNHRIYHYHHHHHYHRYYHRITNPLLRLSPPPLLSLFFYSLFPVIHLSKPHDRVFRIFEYETALNFFFFSSSACRPSWAIGRRINPSVSERNHVLRHNSPINRLCSSSSSATIFCTFFLCFLFFFYKMKKM